MNRGPLLMLVATFVLTCMSATVKVARSELGALDIVVWRSLFAIPFAWWCVRRGSLQIAQKGTMAVRVCLGFGAMFCFFTALKGLPLADTNLITKLQPVLIARGAPLFLGRSERVTPRTWVMLAIPVPLQCKSPRHGRAEAVRSRERVRRNPRSGLATRHRHGVLRQREHGVAEQDCQWRRH